MEYWLLIENVSYRIEHSNQTNTRHVNSIVTVYNSNQLTECSMIIWTGTSDVNTNLDCVTLTSH